MFKHIVVIPFLFGAFSNPSYYRSAVSPIQKSLVSPILTDHADCDNSIQNGNTVATDGRCSMMCNGMYRQRLLSTLTCILTNTPSQVIPLKSVVVDMVSPSTNLPRVFPPLWLRTTTGATKAATPMLLELALSQPQ